ncbi:hypothetical protein [Methylobacterium sp. 092160098-2]|uniref:hypothetical protein n=1 Tax=Methylobacterium sp. 092160098-2 TaxID=3025129 RepID=UPI002381B9CC|nr:hypothetical protein [Methylobacterium sp. 092160098-2]MDE4914792.1 hypothetical protein [Methylobacterium sp. 092160098-2]
MPAGSDEVRVLDDGPFATTWLAAAALGHAIDIAPMMRVRICLAHLQEIAFLATSIGSLAFIGSWTVLCLRLGFRGDGRRTTLGVALILVATAATAAIMPTGSSIRIMAFSNGIAALVMLAWAYPVGFLDRMFGRTGPAQDESGEGAT